MCVFRAEEDRYVSGSFLDGGVWEQGRVQNVLQRLGSVPNSVLVDAGANIGTFVPPAAKLGHHVVAFEASPRTADLLRRSVLLNNLQDEVRLYVNGVTDYFGGAGMLVPSFNQGGGRVKEDRRKRVDQPQYGIELLQMDFPTANISEDICGMPVAVLKIDIEGNEWRFLRGAESFIGHARPKLIMSELCTWWLEWTGCSPELGLVELSKLGYSITVDGGQSVPVDRPLDDLRAWLDNGHRFTEIMAELK